MTEQIGRYLVRAKIGEGGFGTVYRAWDPVMRRDVAIKVLTSVSDPDSLARFLSEPATTGALKHKNIITVYDFGEHQSAPYLVMELLDGRSLREAIDGPPLSLAEKVAILGETARGLLHAHQNGVIHRDVKPANIMLLADGSVKVLDFGIARMANPDLTRHTITGMMVGTPEYMAPEQFENEDATPLSDIFAYGVVCYELLSGEQPFRGRNLATVVNLITTKVPAPLRTLVPDCPEALESIVQMAMAKRRSERYQSIQELLFDLAPIEAGFRKDRVDGMAAEAQRSLEAGNLDSAQKLVWQALELDPNHPPSQELRRRIQRRRERLALEERVHGAVEEAESLLLRNSFAEAIQSLEAMRGWLGADSVADLRADVEGRIAAAGESRERARHIEALLGEAQEAAGRRDLAGVSRGVAQVLSLDSGNTGALTLERWVAAEVERARVEAEKAERERQRREELARVRQVVREQIGALRFEDASRSIEVALRRYPGDPDLLGLQAWVEQAFQATRRQAAEALRAEEQRQAHAAQASILLAAPAVLPPVPVGGVPEPEVGIGGAGVFIQQPEPPAVGTEAENTGGETAGATSEHLGTKPGTQAEPPTPPQQDSHSRRWILAAAGAMLLFVAGASGIWWRQHSPGTTAPPSAGVPSSGTAAPSPAFDFNKGSVAVHSSPLLPDPPPVRGPAAVSSQLPAFLRGTRSPDRPAPVVSQFTAEPASIQRGQSFTLRWEVAGAVTGVSIDQGIGSVQNAGARRAFPSDSTTYTLTAKGPGGVVTASASVSVTSPPAPVVVEPSLRAGATKVNAKDGLTYVWIPPGTFQMGCSPGDTECDSDEKPPHKVTITKGFWLGQTEVTQEAWQRVMRTDPSNFKGAKLPVENITWNDAKSYCQAAGMRLPTEAEWEYAARAGSTASRYGNLDGIAWYSANSGSKTHDVGGKQANAWGLQDMLGNVWEWVADWYANYPPGDATDPQGPASGTERALRGGSWVDGARVARVSFRLRVEPAYHAVNFGFRCGGN